MKRHQVHIFATKTDLEVLMRTIEHQSDLQYVRAGLFDTPFLNRTITLLDSKLGIAIKGDNNHEVRYVVADRAEILQAKTVPQHGGGTKYSISQELNPKTVIFQPGGVFDKCVISGLAGTISEDPASLTLYGLINGEIKRQFGKIKSFYVGKEARELLDQGWRLTTSVKSPQLYDLTRD